MLQNIKQYNIKMHFKMFTLIRINMNKKQIANIICEQRETHLKIKKMMTTRIRKLQSNIVLANEM